MNEALVVLLQGGCSTEREVSLRSAAAVAQALEGRHPFKAIDLQTDSLPTELDPDRHLVFPVLHGGYGENGGLQRDLEEAGFAYIGCDAIASALCMDKALTKSVLLGAGLPTPPWCEFEPAAPPDPAELIQRFGPSLVLKPASEGSSIGLHLIEGIEQLHKALRLDLSAAPAWLIEKRIFGRELTLGILNGEALSVVEIRPTSGTYDFSSKYTPGASRYLCPAPFPEEITAQLKALAENAFETCGCRHFARIDFIFEEATGQPFILEINTLPGMTATSLLPMSAAASGYSFAALVEAMLAPGLQAFSRRQSSGFSS